MQNTEFIYWLFDQYKKALYVDDMGRIQQADAANLKPDGQPAHLVHAPDGWRGTLVKYARNTRYWGIFRDFTVPMNFKVDGAKICKDQMWRSLGMEAILYLAINKLNRIAYPPKYDQWYKGELDFSKIKQSKANVNLQVIEGGLNKYLKAFENQTYEIDVADDPEVEYVVMDGMPFTNTIDYTIYDGQDITGYNFIVGMGIISQEGTSQGVLNQDASFGLLTSFPNDQWFLQDSTKDIIVNIKGTLNVKVKNTGQVLVMLQKIKSYSPFLTTNYVVYQAVKNAGDNISQVFDINVPCAPNDNLYLIAYPHLNPSSAIWYTILKSDLTVTYEVTFQETIIPGLRTLRLFQKLVEKMTDGAYTASSSYLSTWNDIVITSGDALRNLPNSKIKTSLSDFFKFSQIRSTGLTIENDTLVIEDLKYFFRDNVNIKVGEVNDFQQEVAEDIEANTIKVGYVNQNYDNVNGKDEFNVTQSYTTPHKRIVKELDLTIPYRADAYGIEIIRINLDGKTTTDNGGDNETFILNTVKGGTFQYFTGTAIFIGSQIQLPGDLPNIAGTITISGALNAGTYTITNVSYLIVGYTTLFVTGSLTAGTSRVNITAYSSVYNLLYRPAYSTITGVLHPAKVFNTELSPKHILINNGALIHSLLDKQDMNFLKFRTGEKNSELSTTLNGLTVTEKADIQIADLAAKLFLPYYFSFKVPTDFNFIDKVKEDPYAKISFQYNDNFYYGYLFDGGVQPATRDVNTMKLLCAPETNLLQLID